jgi:hypothetical protein
MRSAASCMTWWVGWHGYGLAACWSMSRVKLAVEFAVVLVGILWLQPPAWSITLSQGVCVAV